MSQVPVSTNVKEVFAQVKLRNNPLNWMTIRIENEEICEVDDSGSGGFEEMKGRLPQDEPRFVICEVGPKQRLVLLNLAPDDLPVKFKFTYASTLQSVSRALEGTGKPIHISDMSDLTEDFILAQK